MARRCGSRQSGHTSQMISMQWLSRLADQRLSLTPTLKESRVQSLWQLRQH
jgi:hypothetical protein